LIHRCPIENDGSAGRGDRGMRVDLILKRMRDLGGVKRNGDETENTEVKGN
jgi:hypothetical protein